MKKYLPAAFLTAVVVQSAMAKPPISDRGLDVIPMPVKFELKGGDIASEGVKPTCRREKSVPAEGYRLSVTPGGVTIVASDDAGEFYARQTLRQLPRAGRIRCCEIEDAPKYPYRGVMVDEGRHFFGKKAILKTLDLMAEYKLNAFHWHLTEDQGWRIEIKSHPELARVGSKRPSSPVRRSWDIPDGVPYGPFFYTQDEIREVVAYAKARHVMIYPEIDMPGHIRALLASHPELLCEGHRLDAPTPWTEWGISEDMLCLGNPATLALVRDILDEVCDLFPDAPYVHIGGDECPVKRWAGCPRCRALKEREKIASFSALQGWFSLKVAEMLRAKGKRMAGWSSLAEIGMDPPKDTVLACGCYAKGWECTAKGYQSIMAPNEYSYFYFNQGLKDDPYDYGWFWSGSVSLLQVYSFSPAFYSSAAHRKNVIGGEAHLWSEYTLDASDLDWKLWPRLFAMSEALWTEPEVAFAVSDFVRRARLHREVLVKRGVNVARIEVDGLPRCESPNN